MKKIPYPSDTRGIRDHGWLKAKYSFSFGSYFDKDRLGYGKLRVLNDDLLAPKMGFGHHPHENMEIVTIPLKGSLKHRDSMGNEGIVKTGEVQVMSAGTGVEHSEFNASDKEEINLLQIWVVPETQDVEPRYDQQKFDLEKNKNKLVTLVSPKSNPVENSLWIHQQAYFNLGKFDEGQKFDYVLRQKEHGVYLFVISGQISTADEITLSERDAIGVWEIDKLNVEIQKEATILLIEIPMN